jgi:hypothetical protein
MMVTHGRYTQFILVFDGTLVDRVVRICLHDNDCSFLFRMETQRVLQSGHVA